jgi:hypothetical protein
VGTDVRNQLTRAKMTKVKERTLNAEKSASEAETTPKDFGAEKLKAEIWRPVAERQLRSGKQIWPASARERKCCDGPRTTDNRTTEVVRKS